MRKAIETLKNIWKIEDLRQRILITILFVAIYRFGSYVVLPGINPAMLAKLHEQTSEGLLALLNMFSGGAFSNASIFALGIMPYISACCKPSPSRTRPRRSCRKYISPRNRHCCPDRNPRTPDHAPFHIFPKRNFLLHAG